MTQRAFKSLFNRHGKGQSLVEVALFLPIFLIILAGLVEVSSILVTQNSVHNAARVGARFGANGGQDEGIAIAALNSVTDVLKIEDGAWDIWAVRGKVAANGNSLEEWEFNHVYGLKQTKGYTSVVEADIKKQVLAKLQIDENGNKPAGIAGGIEFVGTYLVYDLESILGLNALQNLAGMNSVRSLNVMSNEGTEEVVTDACTAFPMAVDESIRSVLKPGDTGANSWRTDFEYPTIAPNYYSFVNHQPNMPFLDAREGYLYNIKNLQSSGAKGWLAWNQCEPANVTTLVDSLTWPGNSNNYTPKSGTCTVNSQTITKVAGFIEVGDSTDKSLHINDLVGPNTSNANQTVVKTVLNGHVDLRRTLRVVAYKDVPTVNGISTYRISKFAIMRIIGYSLNTSGNGPFILAEFIRWDDSCGKVSQ